MEKRETLEQFAQHADKWGEARMGGAAVLGSAWALTTEQIIGYLTIFYLLLQIGIIVPKYMPWIRKILGARKKRRKDD